ncbi:MAG TPA: sulfotransferase [Candidatus Cybelea sp.]|nr:sulfotransferase [Candidatus Cybelea sp.]
MTRHSPDRAARKSQKLVQAAAERHRAGQLGEAEKLYRRALQQDPRNPDAMHLLGVIAFGRGEHGKAIELLAKVVELQPASAAARSNLGNVQRKAGRIGQAVDSLRRACELDPRTADTHLDLASALVEAGDSAAAIAALRTAADQVPKSRRVLVSLGNLLSKQGAIDESIERYRRALELEVDLPAQAVGQWDDAAIWNVIGAAHRSAGRIDEATRCFRKALELRPDYGTAYGNLVGVERRGETGADVARLTELLARPDLPESERASAHFSLGKCLDDENDFDGAFAQYSAANALVRRSLAAAGDRFDTAAVRRDVDRLIATFTPEFFAKRRGWGLPTESHVFIVGMPRSGTTLVEQIAASHSQVFGAGELKDVGEIGEVLAGLAAKSSSGACALNADGWTEFGIRHMAETMHGRLTQLSPAAARIIDKMPENVVNLGLIALMFPNARIIFCRRDPRDTCLSCYFQRFADGNAFSYDLRDCGFRHFEVDRLIDHWHRVLPLKMLDIRYETLVAALEPESRRLIEFLGLPWEERCLEFHRTERVVTTLSVWQVRQPLYASSVGRWRNYERHLGPLLEGLRGVPYAYR